MEIIRSALVFLMAQWEREDSIVKRTDVPITRSRIVKDVHALGVTPGDILIVHTAMSKIGWILGDAVTVIDALMEAVTTEGTLVLPAMTTGNTEPSGWNYPPVPEAWWPIIRKEMPPFAPDMTPVRGMGRVPETFRKYPGVVRSSHPQVSFASWGRASDKIVSEHPVDDPYGPRSPLGRLYDMDAKVLLIGVDHTNNTSLHLAEHLAEIPHHPLQKQGAAMLADGKRIWRVWTQLEYDSDDFHLIGEAYENEIGYSPGKIGFADSRLHSVRAVVDYGVRWLLSNRSYEK